MLLLMKMAEISSDFLDESGVKLKTQEEEGGEGGGNADVKSCSNSSSSSSFARLDCPVKRYAFVADNMITKCYTRALH